MPTFDYESPALFQQMTFLGAAPLPRQWRDDDAHGRERRARIRISSSSARSRSGILPGPHLDVTGPFLDGPGNPNLQMYGS